MDMTTAPTSTASAGGTYPKGVSQMALSLTAQLEARAYVNSCADLGDDLTEIAAKTRKQLRGHWKSDTVGAQFMREVVRLAEGGAL